MPGFQLFTIQVILTPRMDNHNYNYNNYMRHYNPTPSFISEGPTSPPGLSPSAPMVSPNSLSLAPSQSILTASAPPPELNSTLPLAPSSSTLSSAIPNVQQTLSPAAANTVTVVSSAPPAMPSQARSTGDRRKRRYRFLCF